MSDKPSTSVPPAVQIGTFSRSQDFRTLFANQSRISVGPGEIGVIFSYVENIPNIGQILTELVSVVITPTHAKVMAAFLTESLKVYEETFGAIPLPAATPFDMQKVRENVKKATGIDMPP
jgi:Protein of unknown function (DUF3467)